MPTAHLVSSLGDAMAHAGSVFLGRLRPAPSLTPVQAKRVGQAEDLIVRARSTAAGPPVDVLAWQSARDGVQRAERALQQVRGTVNHAGRGQQLRQALPAALLALGVRVYSPQRMWLSDALLLAAGLGAQFNLAPLFGRHRRSLAEEVRSAEQLARAEHAAWANNGLLTSLGQARERLGNPLAVSPAPSAAALRARPVDTARAAVDALAARLDEHRRRHHAVAAQLHSQAAEAALRAADPALTAHARTQAGGIRAFKVAGVALAVSFAVGFLHPFASFLGFLFSGVVLLVAGGMLLLNLRRALGYLDGLMTETQQDEATDRLRHRALANLAERQAAEVRASWQTQLADESTLVELRRQLMALAA